MSEVQEAPVVDPQATEENVAPAPESTAEQESESKPVEPKVFTQDEVDSIVQKRIAKLERKAERQRIEAETRAKVMSELQPKEEPQGKPTSDQYPTYDDYLEALADWKAEQKYQQIQQREQEKQAQEKAQTEQSRYQERQSELLEAGESEYDDFEDVVKSDRNEYSRAAYLAILESDIAHKLVYHLAKNPEDAAKIAQLPAYAQAKEIGKLEDKLQAKPQKQVSKAPAPITPITTGKSGDTALGDDLPIDEWMRRRQKQLSAR